MQMNGRNLNFIVMSILNRPHMVEHIMHSTDLFKTGTEHKPLPNQSSDLEKNEMNRALGHLCAHIG